MTDWVVSFVPDAGGHHMQEAHYATEEEARRKFEECGMAGPDQRVLVQEKRGHEYFITPSRYCVLLASPAMRAGQEATIRAAHAQHSEGGLITGGKRSSH